MSQKKLLHVISSMNPKSGGPCQGIRNYNSVKTNKYVREVVCLDNPNEEFLKQGEMPKHALGEANNIWGYSSKLLPWLVKNLPKYDVVIINGLWQYTAYATWKAVRILKKQQKASGLPTSIPKIFVMPHGMLDPYFQKAAHRKLKAIRNWFYWKLIESKVIKDADGLLFTCEEELLLARTTFKPYLPKKEYNVGYGIQAPPLFTPAMTTAFQEKCAGLNGHPYFLFLSRIERKKGVDLLIKAYLKTYKDADTTTVHPIPKLVIAGPGLDTAYGKEMIKLAAHHKNIYFPGMVNGDAKWGAFYGCEAFILASHQENFGIVIPEALACHKPVLISDKINIWREVQKGGGGFVTTDTLEGTLSLFTQWKQLSMLEKEQMAKNAYTVYSEYFMIERAHKNLINVIFQ